MSRLSKENSAYLKHSSNQKIDWYPWSEEAFNKARDKGVPVFLSSGAVWCHWCHVMANECFHNDDLAEFLNNNFIAIKLDRDERPDIDRRYQMAVTAMGTGGGWPLSVFLTPEKVPFYGGTYFPPVDRHGRPGLKKVLTAVLELYKTKQSEIDSYTENLMSALKSEENMQGGIDRNMLNSVSESAFSEHDSVNGGFGSAPKFPMPGIINFMLNRYYFTGEDSTGKLVKTTLDAMALGGFYDHVGGGFHRYSTDESWIIPHFEKMADDNSWLLRNYLYAYSVFGDSMYRDVAEGIIQFLENVLSDRGGCFYASQDADITPEDEGGYFTWRDDDFKRILNSDEYTAVSLYFLHEQGSMHHDDSKKVLFIGRSVEDISRESGIESSLVISLLQTGKKKLLKERGMRETPFIDKTIYTSINGLLISSFILASRILQKKKLEEFAVMSLNKIMSLRHINDELYHSDGVKAFLDDYIFLTDALIDVYEVTGKTSYLDQAIMLMGKCIDKLWDIEENGFFDTDEHLLGLKVKAIEDIPHPSANASGIRTFLKLYSMTGNMIYRQYAEKSLKAFSGRAAEVGIHAGQYFNSLDAFFNTLKMTFHSERGSDLYTVLMSRYSPYTDIVHSNNLGYIVPCEKDVCFDPLSDKESLVNFMDGRKATSKG